MSHGIDFEAPVASIDWDQFVSPNPLYNTTAEIAQFCIAGLQAIGFPAPSQVWIQGQRGDGMAAASGVVRMNLGEALKEGLDPKKPVNIQVTWVESAHSVAMIVKKLSGSVRLGGRFLFGELKAQFDWDCTFEEFMFEKNGNALNSTLASKFNEAR